MSASSATGRIEISPAVKALVEGDRAQAALFAIYVRYLEALLAPDVAGLDLVVTADVLCHELDAMGLPPGLEGLKIFRRQVNGAIPDEQILINTVWFAGDEVIETDLVMEATQTGEIFGIPATNRRVRFDVHERCRFVDGKLAERRAQLDVEDIRRQLTD